MRPVLPGRSAISPSQPAGNRSRRAVLPGVLAVGGGRTPGHHQPPELGLPDSLHTPWPLSLLSRAVPHLGGIIAPATGLVPKYCCEVSLSPLPVTISSNQVAFSGVNVSFPGAVIALLSDTIAA